MKKNIRLEVVVYVTTLAATALSAGAAPGNSTKPPSPSARADTGTPTSVDLKSIQTDIDQSLKSVLSIVQDRSKKADRSLREDMQLRFAIDLLGDYRYQQATRFLVNNVSLETHGLDLEQLPFSGFSSLQALIKIGNPSVQEILRRIKPLDEGTEYPERDLHLFAYIIREVDGQEVGLFRLQLAAKDATGTHKLNLLNLIEIYEKRESELQIRQAIKPEPESPVAQ